MNIKICNEVTALIVISHNVILIENAEAQLEQNTKKKKNAYYTPFGRNVHVAILSSIPAIIAS